MRKLGLMAVAGLAGLALALGAWTLHPSAVQGGATISGKIKFTGTKPANPKIDMSEEPKCKAKYQGVPTEEVVVANPNGTLANVFVYVKSGLPATYKAPEPAIRTGVATILTYSAFSWVKSSPSRTRTVSSTTSRPKASRTGPSISASPR